MIRLEHLAADVHGLSAAGRAALSGRLRERGVARAAGEVGRPEDRYLPAERAHLARWLEARITRTSPPVAVLESLRALAAPGASCVVAEADPGLLGGPLGALLRAAQAVGLARELSREGPPVLPVLWCRGDTARADELRRATVLNRFHEPQTVCLEELGAGRRPLDQLPLEAGRHGLGALRAVLRQLYGDHPHIEEALDLFVPRDGETLPAALARAAHGLLGSAGLVVIEPEMLREELSGALARLVGAPWEDALEGDPLAAELDLAAHDEPLVTHLEGGRLRPLVGGGEGYRYPEEPGSRTAAELAAAIVQDPACWQAGPDLAPLARDLVLPVAAIVTSSEELERQLRLHPVRRALGLPEPALVPGLGATLVDAETRGSLERLGAPLAEVLRARGGWRPAGEAPAGPGALERLAEIEAGVRAALSAERRALGAIDPTLAPVVRTAIRNVEEAFRRLTQRVEHVQQNRSGKRERHVRRLNATLSPEGRPQAEVLPAFAWLSRHGPGWLEALTGELDPFAAEHLVVHLED